MGSDGVVLIDKPKDITSRRALDKVMRILKVKRAGHFGTLDPFATGLLCIGVGQGTKLLPYMEDHRKEYLAVIGFDMCTDTDDVTGIPLERYADVHVDIDQIHAWLAEHTGAIWQVPPDYCAQKQNGKPLYRLKRAQQEVSPKAKEVCIYETQVLAHGDDFLTLRIVCSRGTYIRSIARDLGKDLGVGGYLRELRRVRSEGFFIDDAVTIDELKQKMDCGDNVLLPLSTALHLPRARVTSSGKAAIQAGRPIHLSHLIDDVEAGEGDRLALLDNDGILLCIARVARAGGVFGCVERGFHVY